MSENSTGRIVREVILETTPLSVSSLYDLFQAVIGGRIGYSRSRVCSDKKGR